MMDITKPKSESYTREYIQGNTRYKKTCTRSTRYKKYVHKCQNNMAINLYRRNISHFYSDIDISLLFVPGLGLPYIAVYLYCSCLWFSDCLFRLNLYV